MQAFLERAWSDIAAAARPARTWRWCSARSASRTRACMPRSLVINRDGTVAGFQDKVQVDPSEDGTYTPAADRQVFQSGSLTFGVSICHEGWRYPETVRWAARRGAHVVFHPHYHPPDADSYRPSTFADPANTFHEKAMLCRAAENTATSPASTTRSTGRRPRPPWCGPTARCRHSSPMARKGCSWPTSISKPPRACWPGAVAAGQHSALPQR